MRPEKLLKCPIENLNLPYLEAAAGGVYSIKKAFLIRKTPVPESLF